MDGGAVCAGSQPLAWAGQSGCVRTSDDRVKSATLFKLILYSLVRLQSSYSLLLIVRQINVNNHRARNKRESNSH